MTPPEKPKPQFRAPKFFWTLLLTSIVLFCILDDIRVGIEKERELEEMKQEHYNATMEAYMEYLLKKYEEDTSIYNDSIDSIKVPGN